MKPPRLALLIPNLDGGGAERVFVNLARGFAARGLVVDLVLAQARGTFLSEVPPAVRIVDLRARSMSRALLGLIRYLRRHRPAVLLSSSTHANLVALFARRVAGVRTRCVIREAQPFVVPAERTRGIRRLLAPLATRLYPWADEIIAVSQGVAQTLASAMKLPPQRIRVAANPVVTAQLLVDAGTPAQHPWFAPGEPPVIVAAGRLSHEKDFATLLRAFARVRHQRPARLLILGEGEQRQMLEALSRQLGIDRDVGLPGFIQRPFPYMAGATVFVLSSLWEGCPGVLIQALACGTPVVATDCDSGPREVLRGGRYGRLVPVGDAPALADAVIAALDEPRRPVPPESWSRFGEDAAVEDYLRILGLQNTRLPGNAVPAATPA
jgi:glycosyltransferase involved in cell wall biosynthesis